MCTFTHTYIYKHIHTYAKLSGCLHVDAHVAPVSLKTNCDHPWCHGYIHVCINTCIQHQSY